MGLEGSRACSASSRGGELTGNPAKYEEDELLPLSLLAQLAFCERRAALIYIERLWDENAFTAQGRLLHDRAHQASTEVRGDVRIARGLLLRSARLGLSGKSDVVEFHRIRGNGASLSSLAEDASRTGVSLPGVEGRWQAFPVEYKRGRRRHEEGYEIQLCAQALCLEEMLGGTIPAGALFYAATGRRLEVSLDASLRAETERLSARLHELVNDGRTPRACREKKCQSCSLIAVCAPRATGGRKSGVRYLDQVFMSEEQAGD